MDRTYLCIDMKTFYASVECAERGLNPFETNLVVADVTRGKNALCLAITPKMKAMGIKNRCRLSEIPLPVQYEIAPPRMQLYIDYAADIYEIYLGYFSPDDIHVYSIDESFIDVTQYLELYKTDGVTLAKTLMNEIADRLKIPSTAGVGTNLYLAKIALDITAKHAKDHIGILTEETYKQTLWDHEPLTDFWQIAAGTAGRLARYGIKTMRGITNTPEGVLYKLFGVNAELLIDHAYGRESCRMCDIKNYRSKTKSVSFSQILPRNYTKNEALTVIKEMFENGAGELRRRKVIAGKIFISVGYASELHEVTHGGASLTSPTALVSKFLEKAVPLYNEVAVEKIPVRRLGIGFSDIYPEECEGYDLFTDREKAEKEKAFEKAVDALVGKYGKNAVLRGTSCHGCATQKERNGMIGGHRSGL